jgi:hypothetical protein
LAHLKEELSRKEAEMQKLRDLQSNAKEYVSEVQQLKAGRQQMIQQNKQAHDTLQVEFEGETRRPKIVLTIYRK